MHCFLNFVFYSKLQNEHIEIDFDDIILVGDFCYNVMILLSKDMLSSRVKIIYTHNDDGNLMVCFALKAQDIIG